MPAIIIPSRWTKQPSYPVEVDWSNPLTRDLVYAFAGNYLSRETVVGTKQVVSRSIIRRGFGSTVGAGTTDRITTPVIRGGVENSCFVMMHKITDGASNQGRIFVHGNNTLHNLNAGTHVFFANHTTTGGQWNLPAIADGFVGAVAITYDGSLTTNKPRCWIDGVEGSVTTTTTPVGTHPSGTGAGIITIGQRASDDLRNFDGSIGPLYVFRRVLQPSEVIELTRNPWQIFKPLVRRIYFDVAAGVFQAAWARNRNSLVQAGMTL